MQSAVQTAETPTPKKNKNGSVRIGLTTEFIWRSEIFYQIPRAEFNTDLDYIEIDKLINTVLWIRKRPVCAERRYQPIKTAYLFWLLIDALVKSQAQKEYFCYLPCFGQVFEMFFCKFKLLRILQFSRLQWYIFCFRNLQIEKNIRRFL